MARKRARTEESPEPRKARKSRIRSIWSGFKLLLVLALLLYGALLVIGRTEGFRSLVAQRLEKVLGMPVKIGAASLNPKYGVTLRDVESEGMRRDGSPGIRAKQVQIEWRWGDVWRVGRPGIARIGIEQPVLVFEEQGSGDWMPASLAPVGEFLLRQVQFSIPMRTSAAAQPPPTPKEKKAARAKASSATALVGGLDASIVVKRGEVSWWKAGTRAPLASIEGATLYATPLHLPEREVTHYLLKVDRAASSNSGMQNLIAEVLDARDQQLILRFVCDRLAPQEMPASAE